MKKILILSILALGLFLPTVSHANIAVPWTATSTDKGYIQPTPVNGNNPFLKILSISTSTFQNGINLVTGCFSVGGTCIGSSGGTPGGASSTIQYNKNGVFGGLSSFITDGTNAIITGLFTALGSIQTTTIQATSTATSTIANLNTALYVPTDFATNGCAGNPSDTDFGVCVNALYAKLVTQGAYGGQIIVPAIKVTQAQWTTPINFSGPTIVSFDGIQGAQIAYGGTGTSTIFNMANPTGHLVSNDYGIVYMGSASLIAAGNTNTNTTTGIGFGGSNGAVGVDFHDNSINGFGRDIETGANAYMLSFHNNAISGGNGGNINGNLFFVDKSSNSGERLVVDGNAFTDPGNLIATSSVYIQNAGNASAFFTNNSFDDAGIYVGSSDGTVELSGNHFENSDGANYPSYYPVENPSSDRSTEIIFNDNEIANDFSGNNSFHTIIQHGAQLYASGNHLDNYGGGTVNTFSDHSNDNGLESEIICQTQVQAGGLTNIVGGNGNVAYSLATGATCVMDNANSYPIGMNANSNNVNDIFSGTTNVATFDHNGNWVIGVAAVPSLITIQNNLLVAASSTVTTVLNVGGLARLNGGASTTAETDTGNLWLTNLGTPAGAFLAVDPNGLVITTTTPSGGSAITLSGAVTGSGTTAITTAFGSESAGVLGTSVTGIPTSLATSTLYGAASTGGYVLQWSNVTNGLVLAATSTGSGSGIVGTGIAGQTAYYAANGTALTATSTLTIGTTTADSTGAIGNVGIGTTSPSQLLSVQGNGYLIGGLGVGTIDTSAGTLITTGNGNIGGSLSVGSNFSTYPFSVVKTTVGNQINYFQNLDGAANDAVSLFLDTRASLGDTAVGSQIESIRTNATNSGDNDLEFFTSSGTTLNENLVIKANRDVGVGTTSPYALLSIGGNVVIGASTAGGTLGNLTLPALGTPAGAFLAVSPNGQVITTTTPSGGSGITAITGPTGLTFAGTPTSVGTLASGYSLKKLPSYTVGAAGDDFTTIQAALNQCGTDGGGQIFLTDATYAQGTTGLLWKGSNCAIYGRSASTTITFTGATTGFKTNSAASDFNHDEIHNITISGDGTAGSVGINISDMSHNIYDNIQITDVGQAMVANDTQNFTFYNTISNQDWSALTQFGLNASSTNPVNANTFTNIFIGSTVSNVVAVQINNANGNTFENIRPEPGSLTGTVGLKIFDNTLATNNGVFNNTFSNWYVEANGTGISGATTVNPSAGGLQRNIFSNMTVEANTTDWSLTVPFQAKNSFVNGYDSNFGNPLTSFQGPFGVGTSTEMQSIGTTPWTFFGISPQAGVATNDFTIGSSTGTLLNVNNAGQLQVNNGGQINHVTSGSSIPLQVEADSAGDPISLSVFDNGFANTADLVKINQVNGSDSGPALHILDAGTGPALYVQSGNSGFGTSTPTAEVVSVAASTTAGTTQTGYKGVVFIIAGLENTVTKLFFEIDQWGHQITSGDTPSVSGGTSSVAGNDNNGNITVTGTALTSVVLTFAHAWMAAPDCVTSDNSLTFQSDPTSVSATAMTIGFTAGVTTGTVWYQCRLHQ